MAATSPIGRGKSRLPLWGRLGKINSPLSHEAFPVEGPKGCATTAWVRNALSAATRRRSRGPKDVGQSPSVRNALAVGPADRIGCRPCRPHWLAALPTALAGRPAARIVRGDSPKTGGRLAPSSCFLTFSGRNTRWGRACAGSACPESAGARAPRRGRPDG